MRRLQPELELHTNQTVGIEYSTRCLLHLVFPATRNLSAGHFTDMKNSVNAPGFTSLIERILKNQSFLWSKDAWKMRGSPGDIPGRT